MKAAGAIHSTNGSRSDRQIVSVPVDQHYVGDSGACDAGRSACQHGPRDIQTNDQPTGTGHASPLDREVAVPTRKIDNGIARLDLEVTLDVGHLGSEIGLAGDLQYAVA